MTSKATCQCFPAGRKIKQQRIGLMFVIVHVWTFAEVPFCVAADGNDADSLVNVAHILALKNNIHHLVEI